MDKVNFSAFCLVVLVALALAMCGVLLINSSTNIAYAHVNGLYEDNVFPINDCTSWSYNIVHSNSSDSTILYEDDNFKFVFYGLGSLVNNVLTSSGSTVSIRFYVKYNFAPSVYYCSAIGLVSSSQFASYYVDGNSGSYNSLGNYFSATNIYGGFNANDFTNISLSSGSITLRFIYLSLNRYFYGYVPKTYTNYGYDQGYTDGVNSASGGSISSDITDLSGMVWVVPDSISVEPDDYYTYFVSGTVKHIINNREVISDFDSIQLYPTSDLTGFYSALVFNNSNDSEFELMGVPNDVITFTGGDDISNSALISWLASNNQFLTYTQGYQEGYNSGHQIGYDEGFNRGAGSVYTGVLSDYTILSDYSNIGISNNALNISDANVFLSDLVFYTNFTLNGYTINYGAYNVVGSDDYSGTYKLTLTGSTGYSGYKISSFNIDENSIYKFMFNPDDTFNICISVPEGGGTYLYWTYALQTDGYINGVPYMDLTPYIKPWASHVSCDIYLYNPVVRLLGAEPERLVLHNRTPIFGLVANNLIIDNSNGNYNQGFKDGQVQGEQIGFVNGWNKGNSASGNNFLGLFSAVLDAPVNVISQTLDFELLDFNLKDFFFAMVSIAVILFILRLIL